MNTHDLHRSTFATPDAPFSRGACDALGLEVESRDGELRLSRQTGRQWSVTITAAVLGLLFLTGPLIVGDPAVSMEIAARAVKAASTLFGVCLVLLALYQAMARVSVRIGRREIERVRTWGGLALHRRILSTADVDDLLIYTSAPSPRVSFDLVCRGSFGSVELLGGVRDRDLLERLRRQIMLTAGIRPSGTH